MKTDTIANIPEIDGVSAIMYYLVERALERDWSQSTLPFSKRHVPCLLRPSMAMRKLKEAIRACSYSEADRSLFSNFLWRICSRGSNCTCLWDFLSPRICDTSTDRSHRQRTNCSDLRVLRHYGALRNFTADFQRCVDREFWRFFGRFPWCYVDDFNMKISKFLRVR